MRMEGDKNDDRDEATRRRIRMMTGTKAHETRKQT